MKRWHHFRLRTLLLAFLPAAILFALIGNRLHQAVRQEATADQLEGMGFWAFYSYGNVPWQLKDRVPLRTWTKRLNVRVKAIGFLGDKSLVDDDALAKAIPLLEALPYLENLDLSGTAITDRSISKLAGLKSLKTLTLYRCPYLKGHGYASLASLPHLKSLHIAHTEIEDTAVEGILSISSLEELDFRRCRAATMKGRKRMHDVITARGGTSQGWD